MKNHVVSILGLWWWRRGKVLGCGTEAPGSIPSADIDYSASVYQTLTLGRAFLYFYLSCTICLVNTCPSFLLLLSSISVCKLYKVNKRFFSISVLYLPDNVGTKHQCEIVASWSSGTGLKSDMY